MKLTHSISKNSFLLGCFALITAGLLASVNQVTKGPIAEAERAAARKALLEILPPHTHDNQLLDDTLALTDAWQKQLNSSADANIHLARKGGKVIAAIVPITAPDGYSGKIKMIVGINRNLTIAGVRVLTHSETPGLGDKIELKKSDWILSFNGKALGSTRWQVKKDGGEFDQFTGATITPRAVVKQTKNALAFAKENHSVLFTDAGGTHDN